MSGSNGFAASQLLALVERIERLEADKRDVAESIREVYAEAKGNGFDAKAIRRAVKRRAMDPDKRDHEDAMFDLYAHALGMLADTPLGVAALAASLRTSAQRAVAAGLAEGGAAGVRDFALVGRAAP